ncbi:MAG: aconitate hydratase [Vampirovibrionales bacterium]
MSLDTQESRYQLAKTHYESLEGKLTLARKVLGRTALTTAEKILFSHLDASFAPTSIERGVTMLPLRPDRVAMQDATAQMAILQFMQAGRPTVAVPSTIHCDHLIRSKVGVEADMHAANNENAEVYEFMRSAGAKYGMGFWGPGSGIIHQVVLEKYAFPGGMMVGTDSHTPNAGGLGMVAIGVGGADAADVMAGLVWEVRTPKLVGVHLKGKLSGWTTPKDVILKVLELMTTKGGTNKIVEYFGEGAEAMSCTGKGTITNMGAELGATTSLFGFDASMIRYLRATERTDIAELCEAHAHNLRGDADVYANPSQYFDEVIEIDLNALEPYLVGPHSPDRARAISTFAQEVVENNWPTQFSACLIGSCTNSSYEDLERCANIARQALAAGLKPKVKLFISPGSTQVYETIKANGQLETFEKLGIIVLANACGPCIGNWDRSDMPEGVENAIITSFNRNFPKRNDGNSGTLSFIGSPDLVMLYAFAGSTTFNPLTDTIDGIKLEAPTAPDVPANGFNITWEGFDVPPAERAGLQVNVSPTSHRLEILEPFKAWDGADFTNVPVLIKTQGQTTTDHISPAGRYWLPLRGHLSGISHNMLLTAVDASTGKPAEPINMTVCGMERPASFWALEAKTLKEAGNGSIIVGDENYGEGSSREHAAMSPRLLGVKAVITRSFARIHETNLKKQGVLAFTFANKADYDLISKGDGISLHGLANLAPAQCVQATVHKADGSTVSIQLNHSFTAEQITWFKAGSALNAANAPVAVG